MWPEQLLQWTWVSWLAVSVSWFCIGYRQENGPDLNLQVNTQKSRKGRSTTIDKCQNQSPELGKPENIQSIKKKHLKAFILQHARSHQPTSTSPSMPNPAGKGWCFTSLNWQPRLWRQFYFEQKVFLSLKSGSFYVFVLHLCCVTSAFTHPVPFWITTWTDRKMNTLVMHR